ncbi:MAG: S8 family peptidase, partial [Candidatus Heimdallarchaeaceae archaeon]
MGKGKTIFAILVLIMLMGVSVYSTPLALSNRNNTEFTSSENFVQDGKEVSTNSINNRQTEAMEKKKTLPDFYTSSSIERYSEESSSKYPTLSESLEEKLQNTPKNLWYKIPTRVIVTFSSREYLHNPRLGQFNSEVLTVLPVAILNTNLASIKEISLLDGVTGIYLDGYYKFIEDNWKADYSSEDSQIFTYPSEAYIGARKLLELGIDGNGTTIAILDTGIDKFHPDLDDLDNNPLTNDPKVILENSFVDYDNDGINDTDAMDQHGHGTHCAGIAAGNGILKGVAPEAWLMNGRVLDSRGWAEVSWVVKGIDWAAANGADVISMSIGWMPGDVLPLMNEAVDAAWESGSIVVIAAGNSGPMETTVSSPGMASKALTVGASDIYNEVTYWSSRGPSINGIIDPDVVAPGDSILSTLPHGMYGVASGTSMATPAVAGVAALLKSDFPSADIDFIRSALISTAEKRGNSVFVEGAGLVNAAAAREYLQSPSNFV